MKKYYKNEQELEKRKKEKLVKKRSISKAVSIEEAEYTPKSYAFVQ